MEFRKLFENGIFKKIKFGDWNFGKLFENGSFEKIFLCRGSTNSPSDMHKSSLELSHLFGTTSLDSCLTQNHSFYWKLRKMQTDQDMIACYLRKWDFDSKASKWIFEMHFNEENFKKRFLLKRKQIIYKRQYSRIKHRQPRRKQNHKIKF